VKLAQQDGWKEHAWHAVKQLSRDCPALYAQFPKLLTAAMTVPAPESQPNTSPQ
jgi:hypothetical protein